MSRLGKRVFAEGMALLAERWNREFSLGMSRIYAHAFKDAELTAEEFIAGVERAIQETEFCPNAKQIIDLARPRSSADARAGEVLAQIRALGKYIVPHGTRWSLEEIGAVCGDSARRALVSIGGPQRLASITDESFPFVLRDFARAFAEFEREESGRVASSRLIASGAQRPVIGPAPQHKRLAPVPISGIVASLPFPRASGES